MPVVCDNCHNRMKVFPSGKLLQVDSIWGIAEADAKEYAFAVASRDKVNSGKQTIY